MFYASYWVGCRRGIDESGIARFSVEFECDTTRDDFDPQGLIDHMDHLKFYDSADGDEWEYAGDDIGLDDDEEDEPSYRILFRVDKKGKIKMLDRGVKTFAHDPSDFQDDDGLL